MHEVSARARSVLVVDDSATVRRVVSAMLQKRGWDVRCCADAEEAAASALSAPPDVIVSDLWMPGISGLQLCRLLRGSEVTSAVPVVLLTATSSRRAQFWAIESGAHAYLEKSSLAELPALLDHLAPTGALAEPVTRAAVPREAVLARLGNLLDGALFESVLSNRLRSVGSQQRTVSGLFSHTASMLSSVLSFASIALWVASESTLFVMAHPDDKGAVKALRVSLGLPATVELELLAEEGCERGEGALPPRVYPLARDGQPLGSLALCMAPHEWHDENRALLAVVARELPMMLRPVQLLREMERMALTDALTRLQNRRAAHAALEHELAVASRHGQPLSVALLDLDHFKRVNDGHGHSAGDRVLVAVAAMMLHAVRRADVAARWGGEEFLLLLTHTTGAGACALAERLRAQLASAPVMLDERTGLSVTVSIGVAEYRSGEALEAFLHRADLALYEAKGAGRNRVVMAP